MKTKELYGKLVRHIYGNGSDNDPFTLGEFRSVGICLNDVAAEVNKLLMEIAKRHSND